MSKSKYLQILDYLQTFGGEKYKKAEKCRNIEETAFMEKGSSEGKAARSAFTELVQLLEITAGVQAGKITQWQNSGTFVSYFWCQLKKASAVNSNISLSLFAEKAEGNTRFRVSVELAVEKSSDEEKQAYKRILDLPLDKGLIYISGGNNETEFRLLPEKDNSIVRNMGLKKVQVSFVIDNKEFIQDKDITNAIKAGALKLLKYYNLALGSEQGGATKVSASVKETIDYVKAYIAAKGFIYNEGLVENFYLSLKSKPFVILAGTSGTGKTRLVRLFSEAISAEYLVIALETDLT